MSNTTRETLENIIQETGLKKEKIAELMGMTTSGLWKLRKDPRKMDSNQMERLAQALNVNVSRIFEAIQNEPEFDK